MQKSLRQILKISHTTVTAMTSIGSRTYQAPPDPSLDIHALQGWVLLPSRGTPLPTNYPPHPPSPPIIAYPHRAGTVRRCNLQNRHRRTSESAHACEQFLME